MKTAIQWLKEQYIERGETLPLGVFQEALEKEKEQLKKAFSDGQETPINHPTLPHYSNEEYYNDNYNN